MIHGNLATCRSTGKASQRLVPVPTARICDHPDRTTTTHLARGLAVLFPVVAANPPSRYLPVMLIVVFALDDAARPKTADAIDEERGAGLIDIRCTGVSSS
jgi:hypothetical protein